MKVVINKCFGGFGLSPMALKRLAELQNRPCYFFKTARTQQGGIDIHRHEPCSIEEASGGLMFFTFDIPNPDEVCSFDGFSEAPMEERRQMNERYAAHTLNERDLSRNDPLLVQIVEELGANAGGKCSDLKIVEIPDGVDYEISEYDGLESVHEVHRSWA